MEAGKRNIIFGLFIIVIMVASTLGYTLGTSEEAEDSYEYNGYKFVNVNGIWQTYIGKTAYQFNYGPKELENISIPNFNLKNRVYFLFNPEERDNSISYTMNKIGNVLSQKGYSLGSACTQEEGCDANLPIKSCENITDTSFYFKTSNETRISLNKNCVVLEGDDIGLSEVADKINLKILGI